MAGIALLLGACADGAGPVRSTGTATVGPDSGDLETDGDEEPDDDDDQPDDGGDEPTDDDGADETDGDPQDTDGPSDEGGSGETSGDPDSPPAATVFVQFDGVTLTRGDDDDATTNTVISDEMEGTFSAHDPARSDMVRSSVETLLADYDIEVTDVPFMGGIIGFGVVDCDDQNPNNVVIIYDDPEADWDLTYIVNAVAYQLGVSYGLSNVDDPADAMYRYASKDPRAFQSDCIPIYEAPLCKTVSATCGSGMQSSHDEMLARFGPS
jgi:hypothetical protein